MSSAAFIVVHPEHFEPERLYIKPHESSSFVKNNMTFTNTKSAITYRAGPPGTDTYKKLYVLAPTQQTFGVWRQYELGKKEEPANFRGYQLCYPVSANLQPTAEEQKFIDVVNYIYQAAVAAGVKEVETHMQKLRAKQPSTFVANASGSLSNAQSLDDMSQFIKPMTSRPDVKDSNPPRPDLSKPEGLFIPLLGKKDSKTGEYHVETLINGPGNKRLNVNDLISTKGSVKRGKCTPLLDFSHIYWGNHGSKTNAGSVKVFIVQCNYVPISGSSVPQHSLLPSLENEVATPADNDNVEDDVDFSSEPSSVPFSQPQPANLAEEVAKLSRAPVTDQVRPAPDSVVPTVPKATVRKPRASAAPAS